MNRRILLGAMTAATATISFLRRSAAAPDGERKSHGLVLHVGVNDPELMNQALNNAANVVKYYAEEHLEAAVEIVANGPGLHMLRADTSPVKGRLLSFGARMPQVVFSACNNTKQVMESAEGKEIKIVAQAKLVPAGIVRIMELQEEGWSYARP
jgi:intracellular sulfur oxidation DsrE/DsrF family protein